MTSPVTLNDAIALATNYALTGIHTALPGAIVNYDYTKQKATIQPLLNKVWSDGTTSKMPILENVPVIFPRAGGASLTFPVVEGDTCLLVFIERSIDLWLTQGGQVNPDDPRKFDLSDAVAIMGLFPFSETSDATNNDDVLLTYQNSSITIKKSGDIVINTSSKVAIGNSTTEVLDIVSRILNILMTSLTTVPTNPIQQVPIPPNGDTYTTLKAQLDLLKGMIP